MTRNRLLMRAICNLWFRFWAWHTRSRIEYLSKQILAEMTIGDDDTFWGVAAKVQNRLSSHPLTPMLEEAIAQLEAFEARIEQ